MAERRVPPQGHRRLRAEGVQPGPPDVWLPVGRAGRPGLVIEMKVGRNKPTDAQRAWLDHLAAQGWCTAVCRTWTEAALLISAYLGIDSGVEMWLGRAGTLRQAVVAALAAEGETK